MREPPRDVEKAVLLDVVRREWDSGVDALEHLPVGFGAHHWAASAADRRRLFVTYDRLGSKRTAADLKAAYRAAAALAQQGLEFVLPCLPAASGHFTVPLAGGAVSATAWTQGRSGGGSFADAAEASAGALMVRRLHAAEVPDGIPAWRPLVSAELPFALDEQLAHPWAQGPHGEPARSALARRLPDIRRWTSSYHALADRARAQRARWVPTHGEPDTGNQLVTTSDGHRYLVDWESLKLAPPERDLRTWLVSGHPGAIADRLVDHAMLEMFDLEWRLDEISQYSAWFAAPHAGTESDSVAFEGLLHELERPDWQPPA
jgi:spectinomycin phosphotransferase